MTAEADQFGGEDTFTYDGADGTPYHSRIHHISRSVVHQPNHWGFLKKLLQTKPRGGEGFWSRRRLMRRIRKP